MKSIRYPLITVLAIFVIMLGFGSSMDLSIAEGIYADSGFAYHLSLVLTSFGMYLRYAIYPIFGGIFIWTVLKVFEKKGLKALFIIFAVLCYAAYIYFAGQEPFGVNGYNIPSLNWLGYVIAALLGVGFTFLGYYFAKKLDNKDLWKITMVVFILIIFSMVIGTLVLKEIFHRARYRYLVREDLMAFTPWWKANPNYKEALEKFSSEYSYITSEEFKSFPSGHAGVSCTAMMLVAFLPLFGKKAARCQLPAFIGAFVWTLLMGLSRMVLGAHYLSDVAMGCIINLLCFFFANEFIIRDKKLQIVVESFEK